MNARVKRHVAVVSSPPAQALRLRPLRDEDEAAFTAGHRAMAAEGFTFGLGYAPGKPWRAYLKEQEDHRHGRNLPARHVPGAFLVAEVAGEIVGRTSVRFRLNGLLAERGGHIGYGVLPQHRRRAHLRRITATAALTRPSCGNHSPPATGRRPFPGSPTGGGTPVRSSTRAVGGVMGLDVKASAVAKSSSPGLIYKSS